MIKPFLFIAACVVMGSTLAFSQENAPSLGGLGFTASVDLNGQFGTKSSSLPSNQRATDRLEVREAEFSVFAPIDPWFDGVLTMAAHQEDGQAQFELHEATIGSTKLLPGFRFKLGQFFLGVGRLNRIHRHDWPFTTAPKVMREFFSDGRLDTEGASDSGGEMGYLIPVPFYLDLSVGLVQGWKWGHSHSVGTKPRFPTHYARLSTYFDLPWEGGTQLGLNYLGRKPADRQDVSLLGLDWVVKWKEGRRTVFQFLNETWYRTVQTRAQGAENTLGLTAFPEWGISELLSFGVRFDLYTVMNKKDAAGTEISNGVLGWAPALSLRPSEFTTWRMTFATENSRESAANIGSESRVELQAVFILGAHPAHEF